MPIPFTFGSKTPYNVNALPRHLLIGDIALHHGTPEVHAHIAIGKKDGAAHGGHSQEAHVHPTLELILTESPELLQKRDDQKSGLALIRQ